MGISKFTVSSIYLFFDPCHPERSEGSIDRDFSPTAQNDEFVDKTSINKRAKKWQLQKKP